MTLYVANRITVNPDLCDGEPCIRGMQIRVLDVLELLFAGRSFADILAELPDLELADLQAALRFATNQRDHSTLVPA